MIVEQKPYHVYSILQASLMKLSGSDSIRWDPEDMHGILIVYKCGDLNFEKKHPDCHDFFGCPVFNGKVIEVSWPAVLHDRHVCALCFAWNSRKLLGGRAS